MLRRIVNSCGNPGADEDENFKSSLNPSDTNPQVAAFLHGRVTIKVIEGRDLEGRVVRFCKRLGRAICSSADGIDPYCSVKIAYNKVMQTPVIHNNPFPVWNADCSLYICHDIKAIEFRVKSAKRSGILGVFSKVHHLSMLSVSAAELESSRTISGWFPLSNYLREYDADDYKEMFEADEGKDVVLPKDAELGEIHIDIRYEPIREMTNSRDNSFVAPHTYFPLRCGINLKMYQDADCAPGHLPQVVSYPDYEHGRCWVDLATAIMSSTKLIYITGWSVWPELVMVRTPVTGPGQMYHGRTLGEMLKEKAEQGVRVCVMVWDELTSNYLYTAGVMGTHDEEVVSYFRGSKVIAIKVSRQNPKDGPFADISDAAMFSHHQKTVIVTRLDENTGKHRVEAFLGGLDITDGRYDNPAHPLFRSLQSLHAKPDFYQHCAAISAGSGPRQPWHDIHSHITGTAAWDVLVNFEGRWNRQALPNVRGLLHSHPEDSFVQPAEEDQIRDGPWNVQVLRSINESSTDLDSDRKGLIVRRSANTDQSIHNAYIHHIRNAKHFIYIENQYMIGSSHMWQSGQRGGFASNLVPIEIAEKICAKIRANERFAVYMLIPMFPEGSPDAAEIQEILSHQRKTIALISTRVTKTLIETNSDTTLSDWFNVFCLVNRESERGNEGNGGTTVLEKRLSESRRFMIYIHSKFAVFDDTVVIIGSANINSRSLDGSRDSEIAISAWQPEHTATGSTAYVASGDGEGTLPTGDVAAFRTSLWCEHLNQFMPEFAQPSSKECIMKIRELADLNWQHFASDDPGAVDDMPHGHLALYPYEFDPQTGEISTRQETFPDFNLATIKGKASPGIPNVLVG